MFARSHQPPLVSLFSSTGSKPLQLFSTCVDDSHPEASFVHLLNDDTLEPAPRVLVRAASGSYEVGDASEPQTEPRMVTPITLDNLIGTGYALDQTVLHIQSPSLPKTFIRCPPDTIANSKEVLGLKHYWIHIQVRNIGKPWSFEAGLVDSMGERGVLRMSTFQNEPSLKLHYNPEQPAILHLPLSFPALSSRPLTSWAQINIHLPTYIPYFDSLLKAQTQRKSNSEDDDSTFEEDDNYNSQDVSKATARAKIPRGKFSYISYVKVYANCRLRRIWFSQEGPSAKVPWEFELYGTD